MRTGLENKRNVAILAGLLVVMAIALAYFVKSVFLTGGAPPSAAVAQRQAAAEPGGGPAAEKAGSLANLDPTLHPEWMAAAESLDYTGDGRNIFSMSSAPAKPIEAVKGPVRPSQQEMTAHAAAPSGPPPPPPIDLTFFGYEMRDGVKEALLLHGEDVYIAKPGDVVDHHYKVVRIDKLSIQVTDMLYNNTQTLPLVQMQS